MTICFILVVTLFLEETYFTGLLNAHVSLLEELAFPTVY